MAITLPVSIPSTATDALQPVDEFLMKGLDTNQKYIASKITEGGGDSGGIISIVSDYGARYIDVPISGGEDDIGKLSRVRFQLHPWEITTNSRNYSPIDESNSDVGKRRCWSLPYGTNLGMTADPISFRGAFTLLAKNSIINIEIKEGENWFAIAGYAWTGGESNRVEVLIDGQLPSALGLKNDKGETATDFFPMNGNNMWGLKYSVFGLDGKKHIISIKNNDSAALGAKLEYIDFGYLKSQYSITNKLKMSAGITSSGLPFPEGHYEFNQNTISGHCGAVILKKDGTTYALDGEISCTSKIKAKSVLNFPTRLTTLPMQGVNNFPPSGICLFTTGPANHYFFSYTAKSETNINSASLDGIIWDYVPLHPLTAKNYPDDINVTSPTMTNESLVNYYGTAPIQITNSNNKLDFSITYKGVLSSFTITIPNGGYSADILQIGKVILNLMKSASGITGNFLLNYDAETHLWNFGVNDEFVSTFSLLNLSGPNSSASVMPTLGFENIDLTGEFFYFSKNEKEHLCCKSFVKGDLIDYTSPRITFPNASDMVVNTDTGLASKESFTGLQLTMTYYAYLNLKNCMLIYNPPVDSCGAEFVFVSNQITHGAICVSVDEQAYYMLENLNSAGFHKINSFIITWPKFTRRIKIWNAVSNTTGYSGQSTNIIFQFLKPLYHKPSFEKLLSGEKIIKTVDVSPKIFYSHISGGWLAQYSPQGANDPIKSYVESGSITNSGSTAYLYFNIRYITASNSYIEIKFEIKEDGGGFALGVYTQYDNSSIAGFTTTNVYLTNSATINEGTDIFDSFVIITWCSSQFDYTATGLKAGTYIVRFKVGAIVGSMRINSFATIDKKLFNDEQVENATLNNYSIPVPNQRVEVPLMKDDEYMTTSSEERVSTNIDNYTTDFGFNFYGGYGDTTYSSAKTAKNYSYAKEADRLYRHKGGSYPNLYDSFFGLGREITFLETHYRTTTSVSLVSGNASLQTFSSYQSPVKGLASYDTTSNLHNFVKRKLNFEFNCAYVSGETYSTGLTYSFRIGAPVKLFDGTNYEQVYITSVVTNTSFTTTIPSLIVKASVIKVWTSGFQTMTIINNIATGYHPNSFGVVPLPLTLSSYFKIFAPKKPEVARALFRGVTNGASVSFPMFSDGIRGTPQNTIYQVTGTSAAAVFYSVSVGATIIVSVTGGTIDLLLISRR